MFRQPGRDELHEIVTFWSHQKQGSQAAPRGLYF